LPPLIAGEEEIEYFVAALDDVLSSAEKGSGLFFEFGKTLAKGSMRRIRS
jgi:ornithine--oxo-acid transaminase